MNGSPRETSVAYSEAGDLAVVKFFGTLVSDTVIPTIKQIQTDHRYPDLKGVIWDLGEADLSELTGASLRTIFQRQSQDRPAEPSFKVACVVSRASDVHIIRLWAEGSGSDVSHTRQWFFSLERARDWILG